MRAAPGLVDEEGEDEGEELANGKATAGIAAKGRHWEAAASAVVARAVVARLEDWSGNTAAAAAVEGVEGRTDDGHGVEIGQANLLSCVRSTWSSNNARPRAMRSRLRATTSFGSRG